MANVGLIDGSPGRTSTWARPSASTTDATTSACRVVIDSPVSSGPAGAVVIGLSAGVICFYCTLWIKQVLKIDDSLDVFPVHGVGGILGTFLAGIFASSELGVFSGQGLAEGVTIVEQLKVQLIGIGSTFAYTAVVSFALFKLVDKLIGLRVTADEESEGLDITGHNEVGYDL